MEATSATRSGTTALWGVVVGLLVALVAVVAVKVGTDRQRDLSAVLATACDLGAGPCTAALPGEGAVELVVAPHPIPLAAPLQVRLLVRGADPATGELSVVSTTMDMGTTTIALSHHGRGDLRGEGALPVCVTGTMTWLVTLRLEGAAAPVARFKFDTRSP